MRCSKDQFLSFYAGDEALWALLNSTPSSYAELVGRYLPSKLWRMNNLYSIIDKSGEKVRFRMNFAQLKVYGASLVHPRLIILKSRQQGISTFWLLSYLDDCLFNSNLNAGLMAQGRDEASTLLERLKFAWVELPEWVKGFLRLRVVKDNSSEMRWSNGSVIFIRTSFRSATLQRLHISELGKIANKYPERAKETKTGTLQALAPGNTGVIESTAEGVNMFKTMWQAAVLQEEAGRLAAKDFLPVFLSWVDDPDCVEFEPQLMSETALLYFDRLRDEKGVSLSEAQKNFWVAQYRELEENIHQEYPFDPSEAFQAALDGTYWAARYVECVIRRGRRVSGLYDVNLDVFVALDVGRSDYFVMCFFQVWRGEVRIIGEYYNNGEWLGHYVNYVKKLREEKGWVVSRWFLPHDMNVTDITQREAKTREEILWDLGVVSTQILEKVSVRESIEHVREKMPEITIDEECVYLEQCFLSYTKEWSTVQELWKDAPKKNEFCHGADAIRYTVQAAYTYLIETDTTHSLDAVNRTYGGISL